MISIILQVIRHVFQVLFEGFVFILIDIQKFHANFISIAIGGWNHPDDFRNCSQGSIFNSSAESSMIDTTLLT